MNIDDHGPLAAELRGIGFIQVSRNGTTIKSLPMDHLRSGKARRIEPSGFAGGPAINFAGLCVERIAVERRLGGSKREGNVAAILVPLHPAHHTQRNLRPRLLPS